MDRDGGQKASCMPSAVHGSAGEFERPVETIADRIASLSFSSGDHIAMRLAPNLD
jgi:hypothetical protein